MFRSVKLKKVCGGSTITHKGGRRAGGGEKEKGPKHRGGEGGDRGSFDICQGEGGRGKKSW